MSDLSVEVEGLTLVRRTQEEFHYDLKRMLFSLLEKRYKAPSKRTVLEKVNVSIGTGEKVGIIGANGSGKSTLLKVICGILTPTDGRVAVRGRVAPIIELGAGFDPDLSLVDNIVYYGVLLGFSRDTMLSRVDAILEFAELEDHWNVPVKALSSGMAARLGFAVATEFRPEILILDEVLSVGDEHFRQKCAVRLERFWDAHSTIITVSHDLNFVQSSCDRVIWLEQGRVVFDGPATDGCAAYLRHVGRATPTKIIERDELFHLASTSERGEIIVRGLSETELGHRVYLVRNGQRHWVTTSEFYTRAGYGWDDIIHVADDIIGTIPEGEVII